MGMERSEKRTRMAHKTERPPAKRSGKCTGRTNGETGRHTGRRGGEGDAPTATKLEGRGGRPCQPASTAAMEGIRTQTLAGRRMGRDLYGGRLGGREKIGRTNRWGEESDMDRRKNGSLRCLSSGTRVNSWKILE
jgi:hypothetical protein